MSATAYSPNVGRSWRSHACLARTRSAHASNEASMDRTPSDVRTLTGEILALRAGKGVKASQKSAPTKPVSRPHIASAASHNRSTEWPHSQLGRPHTASRHSAHHVPTRDATKTTVRQRDEDGIFIMCLPVGVWHKLGTQSAVRERAEEYQFLRPVVNRRGRRCQVGLTVACSLAPDDHIVCSFGSRGSRLRRASQTLAGRRYDGSTVRQRWNGGTHL